MARKNKVDKERIRTESEAVGLVDKKFNEFREARRPYETHWVLNLNHLNGNQYCQINRQDGTVNTEALYYKYESRDVFNHLMPIYQAKLSRLSILKPSMRVRPLSPDWEDVTNAKVETSILRSVEQSKELSKKISKANLWAEAIGTAIYMVVWNKKLGNYYGEEDGEEIRDGDVDIHVIPPFEFYPAKQMCDDGMEGQPAVIYARARYVSEIAADWGIDESELLGKEISIYSTDNTEHNMSFVGSSTTGIRYVQSTQKDSAYEIQYYEMPTEEFPNGRLIIKADDVLLHYGDLPYVNLDGEKRTLPFERQVSEERAGHFWGECSITRLLPVQRHYNKIRNLKIEYLNRTAIGAMVTEEGAINTEQYEEEGIAPGAIIEYRRGFEKPTYMDMPPLPAQFQLEDQKMLNEFTTLSGISELSQNSTVPAGLESGIALALLKESDDTRIALTAENIRRTVICIGQKILRLYRQFASVQRVANYTGHDDLPFVEKWDSTNITSDDVVLETKNELSETPAQRERKVLDYMKAGLFNDPATGIPTSRTRARLLEIIDVGQWDMVKDVDQLQLKSAEIEDVEIQRGVVPEVKEFDAHAIHFEEHMRFWLSKDYKVLKATNPEIALQLELHMKLHQKMMILMPGVI